MLVKKMNLGRPYNPNILLVGYIVKAQLHDNIVEMKSRKLNFNLMNLKWALTWLLTCFLSPTLKIYFILYSTTFLDSVYLFIIFKVLLKNKTIVVLN